MSYKRDNDLEFLQYCDTEDLQILVDYLTKDKDGENRFTEELTYTANYKNYYPHNLQYMWRDIAGELQKFGGNTVANMFRGGGVAYRELLIDVAKNLKVNFNKNASVETIEKNILDNFLEKSIHEMKDEELKAFLREFGVVNVNVARGQLTNLAIQTLRQTMIRGGFGTYKLAVIVANQVARALLGRGLAVATNYALTSWLKKVLVFAGPIGHIITGIWTLLDIASPAYRVTIPSVIQIAYMRIKYNTPMEEINWGEETPTPPKNPQKSKKPDYVKDTIIDTLVYEYSYEREYLEGLSFTRLKAMLDEVEGRKIKEWGEETSKSVKSTQNSSEEKVESDEGFSSNVDRKWIYDKPREQVESENIEKPLSDREVQEKKISELEKAVAELKQQLNS